VFGDLTTARHVAVVVPGMNNDLDNFTGGDAERVHHQASQFDTEQVATIQWLGYDTPEGGSALSSSDAEPGAEDLPVFIAGVRAARPERLHWTVVGQFLRIARHRHGALGAGPRGRRDRADRLARRRRGLRRRARRRHVWVGLARFDPVGYSEWHGRNPHDKGFGATRFHSGDISGHSSYFHEGSESLRNIGLITAGYLDDVNVNDGFF
jgi:hypothetical protein